MSRVRRRQVAHEHTDSRPSEDDDPQHRTHPDFQSTRDRKKKGSWDFLSVYITVLPNRDWRCRGMWGKRWVAPVFSTHQRSPSSLREGRSKDFWLEVLEIFVYTLKFNRNNFTVTINVSSILPVSRIRDSGMSRVSFCSWFCLSTTLTQVILY